jgi:hypothetical protein
MDDGKKDITIRNIESTGLYSPFADIFSSVVNANRDILDTQNNLKELGLKIFKKTKREYLRANRHLTFLGKKSTFELLKESDEHGLTGMINFINGFTGIDDEIVKRFLKLAHQAPEKFLTACQMVLSGDTVFFKYGSAEERLNRFTEMVADKMRGI